MTMSRRIPYALLFAIVVLLGSTLLVPPPTAGGSTAAPSLHPVRTAAVPEQFHSATSPGGTPSVASTIDLRNMTVHAGNFVPGNGRQPYAVAYDPLHELIFIGNKGTNFITVLGAVNHSILGYIPIATIGVDSLLVAGDHLYAAGLNLYLVQVINTTTRTVIANVPVSTGPLGFAWDTIRNRVLITEDTRPYYVTAISNDDFSVIAQQAVRQSPRIVAFDPIDDEVFVGDGGDNLNVLNGSTLAYVTNLTIGFDPWAAVWDPLNDHLFVANQESDNMSDVDAHTNQVVGVIPIGGEPNATCLDPTGHWVYVASGERDNISKINATNTSDRTAIPIGAGPAGMACDGASNQVVTANFATNNLTFVNATTGQIEDTVQNGFTPAGEAYDPQTHEVYITDSSTSDIVVWNASSNAFTATISLPGGPTQTSYDPTSRTIFVLRSASGLITEIDPLTHGTLRTIQVVPGARGFAIATPVDRLFASDYAGGAIDAYALSSGTFVKAVNESSPNVLAYCPETGLVYGVVGFADDALVAIQPANGSVVAQGGIGIIGSAITCNPFNNTLYVANQRTQNITVLDATTLAPRGTFYAGFGGDGLAFDPLNAELVVADADDNNLSFFGTVNGSRASILPVGSQPGVTVYALAEDIFVTADFGSGTVSVIRPNTPPPTIASVSLSPALVYASVNATFTVAATSISDYGVPIPPGVRYVWGISPSSLAVPAGTNVSWESFQAQQVAGSGTVDVSATFAGRTVSAHIPLQVVGLPPVPLASAAIAPTGATLLVGQSVAFNATAVLEGGGPSPPGTVFTWTVAPFSLGTLNTTSGSAIALSAGAAGTGTLQLSAWYAGSYAYASAPITVQAAPTVVVARVVVSPASPTLAWGETVSLNATVSDTMGTDVTAQATFAWRLLDPLNGSLRIAPGPQQQFTAPRSNATARVTVTATVGASSGSGSSTIRIAGSANGSGGDGVAPSPIGILVGVPIWGWTVLILASLLAAAVVLLRRRRPPDPGPEAPSRAADRPNPWERVHVEETEVVTPEPVSDIPSEDGPSPAPP